MTIGPRERLLQLIEGARQLADPSTSLGKRARSDLRLSTGLSAEGVEHALSHCLETQPSEAEMDRLFSTVSETPRSHVLLSANVFTAAHRAVALAVAASEQVLVRASRRETHFPKLLSEASPGLFTLVSELTPEPGDTVWAYGSDATLAELRGSMAPGVTLMAHGDGFGIAVVEAQDFEGASPQEWAAFSDALALDTALFDQRGCLSPRLVIAQGNSTFARRLRTEVLAGLSRMEQVMPRGLLTTEEQAEITWYQQCVACVGDCQQLNGAIVALVHDRVEPVPPPGRILQLCVVSDVASTLAELAPWLTCVAHAPSASATLCETLKTNAPHARHCSVGQMQRPPFDGPVDLRSQRTSIR